MNKEQTKQPTVSEGKKHRNHSKRNDVKDKFKRQQPLRIAIASL